MTQRTSITVMFCACLATGCTNEAARRAAIERAQAQVSRIAEDLDQQTTETGAYIKPKDGDIGEKDPWGTKIRVSYSQGGVAEVVTVRSAGPDREFQTNDDLVAKGMSANLKGIGEGIKKNAEATAENAAKGAIKGTIEGVKESLPFKKVKPKKDDEPDEPR